MLNSQKEVKMSLKKRATVYFDPLVHRILKIKAAETSSSISEIINSAILKELAEDKEDIQAFEERISETTISYEKLLEELSADGKI